MAQDLRDVFKNQETKEDVSLKDGHQFRFMAKLNDELPIQSKPKRSFFILKIAAMLVVGMGMGYLTFSFLKNSEKNRVEETVALTEKKSNLTFGSLSPELNKIEKYYIANINLQLTTLRFTDDTKDLMDGYMMRLDELDLAYKTLTIELNDEGPNEHTITALIDNLKLRLKLLFELKNKLIEIKNANHGKHAKSTI